MPVPSEQVIVLGFLFISHFNHIVVQLTKHENIGESQVIANEEAAGFKMFL